MVAILKTTFSNAFSWIKRLVLYYVSNFTYDYIVLIVLIDNKSALILELAWHEQVTSHYMKQGRPKSPTHLCGTRRRWVKRQLSILVWDRNALYSPYHVFLAVFHINNIKSHIYVKFHSMQTRGGGGGGGINQFVIHFNSAPLTIRPLDMLLQIKL